MPAGPWVLVIGAHRSGTSAVTGALVALGLQGVDPSDRMDWEASNPEHFESLTAALYDDDLLTTMGGSWDAPPEPGRWPDPTAEPAFGRSPDEIMAAAYPSPGPLVWKDPRVCLLLPYWRGVLPGPLTAVFVWRDPLSVARSLQARDGMSVEYGLALWERYNRSAAEGLRGVDTYVVDYRSVVEDPQGTLAAVAGWLRDLDRFGPGADRWDVGAAARSVDRGLFHQSGDRGADGATVPADATGMADWLRSVGGGHRGFAPEPPAPVSPWPEALVAVRRDELFLVRELRAEIRTLELDLERSRHHGEAMERDLRSGYQTEIDRLVDDLHTSRERADALERELRQVTSSTSWKVTRPLRSAATRRPRPPAG
jgi:hypothetical protein